MPIWLLLGLGVAGGTLFLISNSNSNNSCIKCKNLKAKINGVDATDLFGSEYYANKAIEEILLYNKYVANNDEEYTKEDLQLYCKGMYKDIDSCFFDKVQYVCICEDVYKEKDLFKKH